MLRDHEIKESFRAGGNPWGHGLHIPLLQWKLPNSVNWRRIILFRMFAFATPYVYLYIWLHVYMQIGLTVICKNLSVCQGGEIHICVGCFASFVNVFSFRLCVALLCLHTLFPLTHHVMLVGSSWGILRLGLGIFTLNSSPGLSLFQPPIWSHRHL